MLTAQQKTFASEGFLQVDGLLPPEEVAFLRAVYDDFLSGTIDTSGHRYDLGSSVARTKAGVENITQIMWPSDRLPSLREHPMRSRALALVRELLDDETMDFDFDMLISKAPHTDVQTPAHQDQAYWVDIPDNRAVSVWVALDESTLDNGCMWYGPRTHLQGMRAHRKAGPGDNAPLMCDATEEEMVPMPLQPGAAGLHAGCTLHYSRGNTTDTLRRAYILNFRPRAMIERMRELGFDHGRAGHKTHAVRTAGDAGAAAAPNP